ncbi:DsbA family protein [Colwellia psychrerythraea]|uniref:DSBA oxidoreductase n=1 Tax=Colwellia psychrerythraea TaxID=28229 RepID=A0A099L295_COLPS|nr:DsbA family protein [Colwellia psychrerythraea]KGJ97069.1 DSBA oxidoreductase [Colwellia psychrerythraea]
MSAELFFIYDSHCPWSYATTPLVNALNQSLPEVNLNLWHCAYFSDADGENIVTKQQITQVKALSSVNFSPDYMNKLSQGKDSTLCANLMTWAASKTTHQALAILNALQAAHFSQGNDLIEQADLSNIVDEFKLSAPAKVFNKAKLTNDAEAQVHEIIALQEIIATQAIPALLLAVNDELILLSHNLYLQDPDAFVDAVKLELNKHS